jgi:hypothetical protein
MKSKDEILQEIEKIKSDDRMKGYETKDYKPANVMVNAPLALIQTTYEGYIAALRWVLEEK